MLIKDKKRFRTEVVNKLCDYKHSTGHRSFCKGPKSIQGAFENIKIIGKKNVKSKQTIFNCLRWIGIFHPAEVLTRAGVKGSFKIHGVTKDKWKASTNALKTVFHRIWIGYCHRNCLKNLRKALEKYKNETK